jgi:HPt (histidine-containing phosphotransfer) domain-containing protein
MDDLIADFVAECREMLEALGGEIVAWEAQPDDRARLDSIFRFVHTVKGNCGFFDFPRLVALSHAAEDALGDVRAGRRHADGALVSAVLAIIDRIGEMVAAIEAGEEMPAGDDSALIAGDALVRGGRLDVGAEHGDRGLELVIRAEGPRILLDPVLRETILTGSADGTVEPRAAGAWLAHSLAAEAGSQIQLSDPVDEVLLIGVALPA